jgi:hypothetical protein
MYFALLVVTAFSMFSSSYCADTVNINCADSDTIDAATRNAVQSHVYKYKTNAFSCGSNTHSGFCNSTSVDNPDIVTFTELEPELSATGPDCQFLQNSRWYRKADVQVYIQSDNEGGECSQDAGMSGITVISPTVCIPVPCDSSTC